MPELLTLSPPPVATAPSRATRCARLLLAGLAIGAGAAALLQLTNWLIPLRVAANAEAIGFDVSQHSELGLLPTMPVSEPQEAWLTAAEVAESLPALRWMSAKS